MDYKPSRYSEKKAKKKKNIYIYIKNCHFVGGWNTFPQKPH